MSAVQTPGKRNSNPEAASSFLRPPSTRASGPAHPLRNSGNLPSTPGTGNEDNPLRSARKVRPSSEVYLADNSNPEETMEKSTQQWIADIDQYEVTLEEMAAATLDQDFKDELSAIEQWFRVLSEAERTAALYSLLQLTTQVQVKFFIQVLQQISKSHPSGPISPIIFSQKDPMSQKFNCAFSKLQIDNSRNNLAARSPGLPAPKRSSGIDSSTINSMFPDAAAAIANQKAEFAQQTGLSSKKDHNSPSTSSNAAAPPAPAEATNDDFYGPPLSPWVTRSSVNPCLNRPKSSSGQLQQLARNSSSGLRSAHLEASNSPQKFSALNSSTDASMLPMMSPFAPSGNWASMLNTPIMSCFNQNDLAASPSLAATNAEMVANATSMKLAALSTVNSRIQLDVSRYRRARSSERDTNSNSHANENFKDTLSPFKNEASVQNRKSNSNFSQNKSTLIGLTDRGSRNCQDSQATPTANSDGQSVPSTQNEHNNQSDFIKNSSANKSSNATNPSNSNSSNNSSIKKGSEFSPLPKFNVQNSNTKFHQNRCPSPSLENFMLAAASHQHQLNSKQLAAYQVHQAQQATQLSMLNGARSRPASPSLAALQQNQQFQLQSPFQTALTNGLLSSKLPTNAFDCSGMPSPTPLGTTPLLGPNRMGIPGINLSHFGVSSSTLGSSLSSPTHSSSGQGHGHHMMDQSMITDLSNLGRSPRGRRGAPKPLEPPTDPALLQDIPAWLRSLRLHKYTENLKDLKWEQLIGLSDEDLEKRGVNALGARRKMLKAFDQILESKGESRIQST